MMFVENWRAVLRYAWTVRLGLFIAVLNAVYVTIAIITSALPVPPLWLALANGILALAVPVLRMIPQAKISGGSNEPSEEG